MSSPAALRKDDTLSASIEVRAPADQVYAVIADVTRIPQWSPEVVRAEWLSENRFQAWNRRRLGRWKTAANVVDAQPGRSFSFVVQAMGGDWTQWTYRLEPVPAEGITRVTQEFRMCMPLPVSALIFERLFLFVKDRRTDLQANLEISLRRIRDIVEAE